MVKCVQCGELNGESAKFCSNCGKPIETTEKTDLALENAKKEFEKDAMRSLDRSKITFICDLCGTINAIDSTRCVRCGKPRPRSEYINALKRIKDSQDFKRREEEDGTAPGIQQPMDDPNFKLYKFEPNRIDQKNPVVQPFVVVPCVSPHHPLWQYNPQQVFRYEENPAPPADTLGDLLEKKKGRQAEALYGASGDGIVYSKNARKVRAFSLISLILSIILMVVLFALPMLKSLPGYKGFEVFKSLGNCFSGAFGTAPGGFSTDTVCYSGFASFLPPVAYIAALITVCITAVASLIKLIKGRAESKGIILTLLTFVFVLIAIIGFIIVSEFGFGDIGGFFGDAEYGLFAALIVSAIALVVSLMSIKNAKVE